MACSCETLKPIQGICDTATGGITKVYIAPKGAAKFVNDASALTVNDEITQSGLILDSSCAGVFVEYNFRPNTGSYTSTIESDLAIGSSSVTTELTLQFTKAEAAKRLAIQSAINAGGCVVIIRDKNKKYLCLGDEDNSVFVTSATMVSGTTNNELSGFTMTLQYISEKLPKFLVDTYDISQLMVRGE